MSAFNRKFHLQTVVAGTLTAIAILAFVSLVTKVGANAPVSRATPTTLVLPSQLGDFRVIGSVSETKPVIAEEAPGLGTPAPTLIATGNYRSGAGVDLRVRLLKWETDAR